MKRYDYPFDSETARANELYRISPYHVPAALVRPTLLVKLAAARTNAGIGYLTEGEATAIERAVKELLDLEDEDLSAYVGLDAFQGGAGTSINMNVNEAIVQRAKAFGVELDAYAQVNLHQSTNDVMPTALRLMLLDLLTGLEPAVAQLQEAAQGRERHWSSEIVTAHTQLQDATVMDAGRIGATWAGALQRDRWRIFKARERLKEVNLGGTAVGTGAGAPRRYVLGVIRELQALTPHPVSRADDPVEATSNYDGFAEAMSIVGIFAQTLRRISQDIRLLSSGPVAGFGILKLPRILKGSSIMPGKVNPVVAEAALQVAERVMANDALIGRLCAMSELQLNPVFPLIAYTAWESLELLSGICPGLADYVDLLEIDTVRARKQTKEGYGGSLALTPLLGYRTVEYLVVRAREEGHGLREQIEGTRLFDAADLKVLFSPRTIQGMGYDEELYDGLRIKYAEAILTLSREAAEARHIAEEARGEP